MDKLQTQQEMCLETESVDIIMETGSDNKLKLYSYWFCSSPHRVRIALNLKGIQNEYKAVNLFKMEQYSPEFRKLNPMGYLPVLVDGDDVISDSFAILMYLDEKYPQHPLLPSDLKRKAINYQKYIKEKVSADEVAWTKNHIGKGFAALEMLLKDYAGKYATGDLSFPGGFVSHTTDLRSNLCSNNEFLIPQSIYMQTEFPLLLRLHEAYNELPAFQNAVPEKQPEAPSA